VDRRVLLDRPVRFPGGRSATGQPQFAVFGQRYRQLTLTRKCRSYLRMIAGAFVLLPLALGYRR